MNPGHVFQELHPNRMHVLYEHPSCFPFEVTSAFGLTALVAAHACAILAANTK